MKRHAVNPFGPDLTALCAAELAQARHDGERMSAMIEGLTSALALTIAIASRGDHQAADTLLEGATAYLYETTTERTKFGAFMAKVPKR